MWGLESLSCEQAFTIKQFESHDFDLNISSFYRSLILIGCNLELEILPDPPDWKHTTHQSFRKEPGCEEQPIFQLKKYDHHETFA